MADQPLTVAQVAEREACSVDTVRRAIRDGELRALTLNPRASRPTYRVLPGAVDDWRALRAAPRHREPARPQPVEEPRHIGAGQARPHRGYVTPRRRDRDAA